MKNSFMIVFCSCVVLSQGFDVNLKHIDYLVEKVVMDGDTVAIIHIYSNYPNYGYVSAPGEGIACVDDATRASVAYLMHYERFKDEHSLNQAKLLLKFVLKMQAEDGGFYNFVFEDLSINKFGQTSNNDGFKWWACRAIWAMGFAYNLFSKFDIEKKLRDTLAVRIERALSKAVRTINKSDIYETFINWKVPAQGYWLLENGTDASAEAVIGSALYYEISKSERAKWVVEKLCKAISTYQFGDEDEFPFGMHPSFTPNLYIWHSWGSRQSYALLIAGKIFNRPDWIESARREIDNFFKRMLLSFDLTDVKPYPERDDQINYGIAPIVQAFIEYGKITGDTTYKMLGGLYGSWWFGNNLAKHPVYDSSTGRFYDAVKKDGTMNLNSGAESVSEGLIGLQTALYDDVASKYLFYKTKSDNSYKIIETENFTSSYGNPKKIFVNEFNWANISKGCLVELRNGDGIKIKFNIENVYNDLNFYTIYVQYRKRNLPSGYAGIEVIVDSIYKFYLDMGGSSSQDYIWIDRINGSFPLHNGEHTIDIYFNGLGDFVWIDYIIIQPLVERKIFIGPDGSELKIERRLITEVDGRDSLNEVDDLEFDIFPNPFNKETNVLLKRDGIFTVKIFDINGRKIYDTITKTGLLRLNFDDSSSGLYFCLINDGKFSKVRKLMLLK
jgi:hypothetical protein